MSTITSPPPQPRVEPAQIASEPIAMYEAQSGDQRIALRNISWELYDQLSDAVDVHQHVRMAYDGKDVELMTTGRAHDGYADVFGWFVRGIGLELKIRHRGAGRTTWKRPEIERGIEADLSYYFTPDKLEADAKSLKQKLKGIEHYPNPDMAIEVDMSRPQIDRPSIYAALKVPEIWQLTQTAVTIEHLQPDGAYRAVESSRFLPVRPDEVYRWVVEEDTTDELAWEERFRAWVRAELAPRMMERT